MKTRVSAVSLAVAVSASTWLAASRADVVSLVIDRSGSMSARKSCLDASVPTRVTQPNQYLWKCGIYDLIVWTRTQDVDTRFDLYEFSTGPGPLTGVRKLNPTPYDLTTIEGALNGYTGPTFSDASTPLADAYCKVVDETITAKNNAGLGADGYVKLVSDGLENSSTISDCKERTSPTDYLETLPGQIVFSPLGPTPSVDGTVNNLLWPSWQAYMLDKGITSSVHKPGATNLGEAFYFDPANGIPKAITNIVFVDPFVTSSPLRMAAPTSVSATSAPDVDAPPTFASRSPSTRGVSSASANPYDGFFALLEGRARLSGGRATRIDDTVRPGSDPLGGHLVAGDVNDSGCVDGADLALLQQVFGTKVSANAPLTYAADVNLDGKVNGGDYNTVVKNWGQGCTSVPGPIPPTPGAAVFSFDTLDWSSPQAQLTLTGTPRTEGKRSLSIGGAGWREITSRAITTSSLVGVTSKLAYDLYIPKNPSNVYWTGATQLYVSCPSAGIYNQFIAHVDLTGRPYGRFTTVQFHLPANVTNALLSSRADLTLKVVVNALPFGESFALDNMRFVP